MRQGLFEIELVRSDTGEALPDDAATGVVYGAVPWEAFQVRVSVHRDAHGRFPAKYMRASLRIDGVDVRYWRRLDTSTASVHATSVSGRFLGYMNNATEMTAFTFHIPTVAIVENAAHAAAADAKKNLGTISVEFYEATPVAGAPKRENSAAAKLVPPGPRIVAMKVEEEEEDGGAFFTTIGGAPVPLTPEDTFVPLPRWIHKSNVPLQVMQLRYQPLFGVV